METKLNSLILVDQENITTT